MYWCALARGSRRPSTLISSRAGSAFGTELGDDLAVDRHSALLDQRFRRPPRRDAGGGEDLLKADHRASAEARRSARLELTLTCMIDSSSTTECRLQLQAEPSTQRLSAPSCRRLDVFERQRRRGNRRLDERARQLEAERIGHLLDLRQIVQVVQAEAFEKLARRRVHERPADRPACGRRS